MYKTLITSVLLLAVFIAVPAHAQEIDTDRDGFTDDVEIRNNYDHRSPCGLNIYEPNVFSYDKGRLVNRSDEGCRAKFLKAELESILGKGNIKIHAKNWHTVVNAFIYGGYSPREIAAVIKRGAKLVHPSIPENKWKNSNDYLRALNDPEVKRILGNSSSIPEGLYARGTDDSPLYVDTERTIRVNPDAVVFGYIYDNSTSKVLKNTEVKLYQYGDDLTTLNFITSDTSDNAGFYEITYDKLFALNGKRLVVRIEKELYNISEYNFTFDQTKVQNLDFKISHRNQLGNNEENKSPLNYSENVEDKLFTVEVVDQNNNKVSGIEVITRVKKEQLADIKLVELSGRTDIAGKYVVRGAILNSGARKVEGTVEITDPIFKTKSVNVDYKNKKNVVIKIELARPDEVISAREKDYKKDLLVLKPIYKDLKDKRNRTEVEISIINEETQEKVEDFMVAKLAKINLESNEGIVEIENVDPDLYLIRIYKEDATQKSGYAINRYAIINVIDGYRATTQLFLKETGAINYSK